MFNLWLIGALNFAEILVTTYKKLGLDESTYTFLVLLARHLKEKPTGWSLTEISDLMTMDSVECSQIFMNLINNGILYVESKEDPLGRRSEVYSLAPLFLKIESVLKNESNLNRASNLEALATKIENIFGVLSARDIEMVQMWMSDDGMDVSLIELALAEMQMYDIRSLKYVDRILLDWKRKNIFTVEEAKRSLLDFRNKTVASNRVSKSETVNKDDYYDWIGQIKKGLK